MSINQTSIVLDSCTRIVAAVTQLCDALDALESIQEQLVGAVIDLADFEAAIANGGGIRHCSPATYKDILSAFVPHIISDLKAYPDGDPIQFGWDALQKARCQV